MKINALSLLPDGNYEAVWTYTREGVYRNGAPPADLEHSWAISWGPTLQPMAKPTQQVGGAYFDERDLRAIHRFMLYEGNPSTAEIEALIDQLRRITPKAETPF